MATAKDAKVMMETSQTSFSYTAATDSGDHTVFTVSGKTIFSNRTGYELSVRPDGVVTGRNMISTHATNNTVTIAGFTCYLAGVLTTISATTDTITRPSSAVSKVNSITVDDEGAIAVVAGTDGATTAFDDTGRGGAGQPPYIPVGSIEIGQVRVTSDSDAVIAASEIFQTIGTHVERFDYPTWDVYRLGDGDAADASAKKNAYIEFTDAIGDAIHTGDAYKPVYVSGATPNLSVVAAATNFKPAKNSHSVSSEQVYGGTIGSTSSSLGQASFEVRKLGDGITDTLIAGEDLDLVFKFYPNRSLSPYILTQGTLGIDTDYPPDSQISAACTISSETKSVNFSS